jgi:cell division protease FtsH
MAEFDAAKDKIMMGAERKSMVMSEEEKEMTAYHEAGHAIVGRLVPEHDPVYKVSIIPRGRALGVTMYLPEQDRVSHSKQHLESMISSLYGGRIAEELIYGFDRVTTGASNDIERATDIAHKMVTQWGLSEKLGPLLYAEDQNEVFMGRGQSQSKSMSGETAKLIDAEIRDFSDRNYDRAQTILKDNMDVLHSMKDALMLYETIDAAQIDDLMARREVRPPRDAHDRKDGDKPNTGSSSASNPSSGSVDSPEPDEKPKNKLDDTDQPSVN